MQSNYIKAHHAVRDPEDIFCKRVYTLVSIVQSLAKIDEALQIGQQEDDSTHMQRYLQKERIVPLTCISDYETMPNWIAFST